MPRWSRSTRNDADDEGSASLEFVVAGVLLLVPLVYLVLVLGAVQEQTLGAEAAARHTARAIGLAGDTEDAASRGEAVLASVLREYGMDESTVEVGIACRPAGDPCPAPGATVVVTVRSTVRLPLLPPMPGLERLASIPVEAQAVQKVSRRWGNG